LEKAKVKLLRKTRHCNSQPFSVYSLKITAEINAFVSGDEHNRDTKHSFASKGHRKDTDILYSI